MDGRTAKRIYSADLLLRQYKRVKGVKQKNFSYKDIKRVYTIVFFETSIENFHAFPGDYIHHAKQMTNTGLQIDFLQEYVLIPLDIFRQTPYNKGIKNQLDAWLAFLSVDDPEWIVKLIEQYPEFIPLYKDVYTMCQNTEKIMGIFSEELKILDKNTVQLMIDEMQDAIDSQKSTIDSQKSTIDSQKSTIDSQNELLAHQNKELSQRDEEIRRLTKLLKREQESSEN